MNVLKSHAWPNIRIFTSSWFVKLPPEIQKVGISRGTPRGYPAGYRKMGELAPGEWFKSVSPAVYHERYAAQLAELSPRGIVNRLRELGGGRDVALLCYEPPTGGDAAWCHRGQVSAWLADTLALDVFEYGHEVLGCGHQHPKLFSAFKRSAPI